jgi:MFS family permease
VLSAKPADAPRAVWIWGTLDALAAALWSGPTGAFLAAFAVELGAGGGQLGLLLALNTLLANGLQLHGAQWTRRGRTSGRVYAAAVFSRGAWLGAGLGPAALALAGHREAALAAFLLALVVSAVATAAASPAMGARASTATGERGRTRYIADRMIATWLGALLGTAGMTWLLSVRPGPAGYALGFAVASVLGLVGLAIYAALLRVAVPLEIHPISHAPHRPLAESLRPSDNPRGTDQGQAEDAAPSQGAAGSAGRAAPAKVPGASEWDVAGAAEGPRPRFGVRVAGLLTPSRAPGRASGRVTPAPGSGWWRRVARRLGAPDNVALGNLVFAAAILQGGAAMVGPASPIWLVHYLGTPSSYLGIVSLASSLAAIASQRLWARWIDRTGPDRIVGIAGAAAALIPVGWLLVRQPWIALPVSAYGGLAWGGYNLAMTSRLLQLAPPADRAAYLGTYAAAVGLAGAIGSLVAGTLTSAVPPAWIPIVFVCSFATRALGWRSLSRATRATHLARTGA